MNKFKFHPVGQGLFYTGSIASGTYNFVYDCGTESGQKYLDYCIKNYIREISSFNNEKPTIDFVVISHLHADHFNGLSKLSNLANIRKVYLPYLGDNHSIIKVILFNEIVLNAQVDFETAYEIFRFACRLYLEKRIERTEVVFLGEKEAIIEEEYKYSVETSRTSIEDNPYWEFIFINKTISTKKIEELLNNLITKIKDFENLPLEEIIKTDEGMNNISKAYKDTFKNLNSTSILLYHYPAYSDIRWLERVYCARRYCCCYDSFAYLGYGSETLLTGDAEFSEKFIEELEKLIKTGVLKQNLGILQVPHHGAEKNWKDFSVLNINADYYVIPYGNKNSYGHPSNITVGQIFKSNKKLISVNDNKSFEYYIE